MMYHFSKKVDLVPVKWERGELSVQAPSYRDFAFWRRLTNKTVECMSREIELVLLRRPPRELLSDNGPVISKRMRDMLRNRGGAYI